MTLRKGQKIINYFKFKKGCKNEDIHAPVFHMDDELFDRILADENGLLKEEEEKEEF